MANALKKHKTADTIKWIIAFLLIIGLIATTVTLFVKLDRQTTVTEIGAEAYMIGVLDESGAETDGDTSIVTRNAVTTDGLKVEIADDADVTYTIYFYGSEDEFIAKTDALSTDFNGTAIPENAERRKSAFPRQFHRHLSLSSETEILFIIPYFGDFFKCFFGGIRTFLMIFAPPPKKAVQNHILSLIIG